MSKTKYRRWQVALFGLGLVLIFGLVGKVDCDSQQAKLDEKINVRDSIKAAQEEDDRIWVAHYEKQARGEQ